MKIDRRSFLAMSVGGAVGTALTPLPWKIQDDLAIWTQMWPWVPIPEKGEVSTVTSACTLCPGGCGISVRKVDDRVVKIEGLAGHPINDGGLCTLGLAGAQLLYGPQRVKAPMKNVGGRGGGNTKLTARAEEFLDNYEKLRSDINAYAAKKFKSFFS